MLTLLDSVALHELLFGDSGWQLGLARLSVAGALLLVLAIAGVMISALGLMRVGRREQRQARLEDVQQAALTSPTEDDEEKPPPLPWYSWLGALLIRGTFIRVANPQRVAAALAEAGVSAESQNIGLFLVGKVAGALMLAGLWWWVSTGWGPVSGMPLLRWGIAVIALLLGAYMPEVVLTRIAARRKIRLEQGLPDALDLLVICAEAGLALQQSIEEVSRALHQAAPDIAAEFAMTAAEFRILPDRAVALENMAKRTGLPILRSLISTLNQSMRFGTSLGESLRVLSGELRSTRLARIEEKAARLPVLLAVPLMIFLMPALLIVIMSPVALRIADLISSMGALK